jgi:hypothetical protein
MGRALNDAIIQAFNQQCDVLIESVLTEKLAPIFSSVLYEISAKRFHLG